MPERRALIVATSRYRDEKLRELRAPAADADRLASVLRDPTIGDFDVEVALDEEDAPLRRRIAHFYADAARDDVLLLHISGHGVKDVHGGLYLAAADSETDLLDATAISARWLDEQVSRSRSQNKLLLLDCCFSGKFPFNSTARAGDAVDVQDKLEGRGRAVITASNAMEYAFEGDEVSGQGKPSYFTAALVEALETGEADRDQDHLISVDELYDFVFDRVKEASPGQTPTKQTALEGPLYVARSNYRRPVKPARLDEDLVALVEHPVPGARLGAVEELGRLARSENEAVALAARQLLERMVDDDSRRVAERASEVLTTLTVAEAPAVEAQQPERPTTPPPPAPAGEVAPSQPVTPATEAAQPRRRPPISVRNTPGLLFAIGVGAVVASSVPGSIAAWSIATSATNRAAAAHAAIVAIALPPALAVTWFAAWSRRVQRSWILLGIGLVLALALVWLAGSVRPSSERGYWMAVSAIVGAALGLTATFPTRRVPAIACGMAAAALGGLIGGAIRSLSYDEGGLVTGQALIMLLTAIPLCAVIVWLVPVLLRSRPPMARRASS